MLDLADAEPQFQPLVPSLIAAHTGAMDQWVTRMKDSPGFTLPLDLTTRANILNNHICANVEALVCQPEGLDSTDALGFFAVKVDPEILLRFKYLGDGAPSNYATKQQKMLAKQTYTEQMALAITGDAELRPPTLFTCGYTIDGEQIGRIEIRRDCKGHLPQKYDIYGGTAVNLPQPLPGQSDDAKPAVVKRTAAQGEEASEAKSA